MTQGNELRVRKPAKRSDFNQAFENQEPQEPMKALNIRLTASRHAKLKIEAVKQGKTMAELIANYIDTIDNKL